MLALLCFHTALLCLQIPGVDQILLVEQFYFFKYIQLLSDSRVKKHTGRRSGEPLALTWAPSMLSVFSLQLIFYLFLKRLLFIFPVFPKCRCVFNPFLFLLLRKGILSDSLLPQLWLSPFTEFHQLHCFLTVQWHTLFFPQMHNSSGCGCCTHRQPCPWTPRLAPGFWYNTGHTYTQANVLLRSRLFGQRKHIYSSAKI